MGVDLPVQAHVVAHMGEQRAAGPYPAGKADGIANQLVRVVGLVETQGVDHQHLYPAEQPLLVWGNGLHIGDIGKAAKAVAQNRQAPMHHLDWQNVDVANGQPLAGMNLVQPYRRNARIAVLLEAGLWGRHRH